MISRCLGTALAVLALAPTPAHAHDSLAPRDARHAWLPAHDEWVMQHWVPFDEVRLHDALGIDNRTLERWLRDDHRTVAQLAHARADLTPGELADRLLAARRGTVSDAQLAVLRERTLRFLTQGHLSQHVLYHWFHGTYALANTKAIFGVDRTTYKRLRLARATPARIGRRGGRTPAQVGRAMRRILRHGRDIGLADESHTRAQAAYMLRRRLALVSCFIRRPMPKFDPGNPYGDPDNGHGPHSRGDLGGLRRDSKEARARRHPRSCWHEPALRPTAREPAAPAAEPRLRERWKTSARGDSAVCHLAGV